MSKKLTYEELEERVKNLEEIESYFKALMKNTDDYFLISDSNGSPMAFNSAYKRVMKETLGIDMNKGIKPHKLLKDKNAIKYWDLLHQRVLNGEKFRTEYTHVDDENNARHFESNFYPILKNGEVTGFTEITRDITDRMHMEDELKKNVREKSAILDAMSELVAYQDLSHTVLWTNRAAAISANEKQEDLIGRKCYEIWAGRKKQCDSCPVAVAIETGNVSDSKIRTPDKKLWSITGYPVKDENGKINGIVEVTTDITEHEKAEQALRESEFDKRLLLDAQPNHVVLQKLDLSIVWANHSACESAGLNLEQITGEYCYRIWGKSNKICIDCPVTRCLKSGHMQELIKKTPDGETWHVRGYPLRNENGKIISVVTMSDNITRRVFLEEHLRQSQKMEAVGTLAGGIAHDFNNMLSIITGNISYVLSSLNKKDDLFKNLSDVQKGANQAQKLTQQLLTFAKGGVPVKKAAQINNIIEESAKFVTRGTETKCNFEFSDDLWIVECDDGQINQAISNLVINANQAMPDGGVIKIETHNTIIDSENSLPLSPGRYINVRIEDKGIGISNQNLPKIFDPYFSTKHDGSGLGLAITYSIIKKHGGHIIVRSEINKGTVFDVYLPASQKDSKEIKIEKSVLHKGSGKILVMDDQELILDMSAKILKKMGYETAFATDGHQAIKMYKEAYKSRNPFDLVLLDLTVPGGMGGVKTISKILKIDPNVKAIVSSGYSNDPVMANFKDYGFCAVAPKPYTMYQLSEILNKIFIEKG